MIYIFLSKCFKSSGSNIALFILKKSDDIFSNEKIFKTNNNKNNYNGNLNGNEFI